VGRRFAVFCIRRGRAIPTAAIRRRAC
jgi:hypothetical protein